MDNSLFPVVDMRLVEANFVRKRANEDSPFCLPTRNITGFFEELLLDKDGPRRRPRRPELMLAVHWGHCRRIHSQSPFDILEAVFNRTLKLD